LVGVVEERLADIVGGDPAEVNDHVDSGVAEAVEQVRQSRPEALNSVDDGEVEESGDDPESVCGGKSGDG
jgi:hypothetical protein